METIDRLRREHAEILEVLDVFEEQLERLGAEDSAADLDVMKEALHYLIEYPDSLHHGQEDLVHRRIAERDPEIRPLLEKLLAERDELSRQGEAVLENVEDIRDDVVVARDEFEERSRRFIRLQREHVQREQRELFPSAERALTPQDWRDIGRRLRRRNGSSPRPGTDRRLYALETHMQQRTG